MHYSKYQHTNLRKATRKCMKKSCWHGGILQLENLSPELQLTYKTKNLSNLNHISKTTHSQDNSIQL